MKGEIVMKKVKMPKFALTAQKYVVRYSPQILTGLGITGFAVTAALTGKAVIKAVDLIDEEKELRKDDDSEFTKVEMVKIAWRPFVPAVTLGIASTVCLVGANSISTNRTAAIATAYQIAKTGITEYKDAVIETIGEEKEREVQQNALEKRMEKNPIKESQIIFADRDGVPCYDPWSDRYFKADVDAIKKAGIKLSRDMMLDMSGYVSLNDFYDEINLGRTEAGKVLGWNIVDGTVEVNISSKMASDGKPCAVINFEIAPTYDFTRSY